MAGRVGSCGILVELSNHPHILFSQTLIGGLLISRCGCRLISPCWYIMIKQLCSLMCLILDNLMSSKGSYNFTLVVCFKSFEAHVMWIKFSKTGSLFYSKIHAFVLSWNKCWFLRSYDKHLCWKALGFPKNGFPNYILESPVGFPDWRSLCVQWSSIVIRFIFQHPNGC